MSVKLRLLALLGIAVMAIPYVGTSVTGHRIMTITVRELHSEVWVGWIWLGIPCGLIGAIMAALLGSRYLSRTLTRALIGALIGSWIAGMLALVGDLGMEVFVIVVVAGLPILGAILGWIAGGGHAYPNLALLGSVVGVVVFWSGASAYTTVQDFAVPYVVPMGLVAGGMVWVLRSGVFWLQRKGRSL